MSLTMMFLRRTTFALIFTTGSDIFIPLICASIRPEILQFFQVMTIEKPSEQTNKNYWLVKNCNYKFCFVFCLFSRKEFGTFYVHICLGALGTRMI